MPLDHSRTAQQIEADLKTIENMLQPCLTVGRARVFASIKDHFLGVADWHEDQGKKQQKAHGISQLQKHLKPATH